jgi:hypothetical protein
MARKIAPSTRKAQEVSQWLEGQCEVKSGEEVLRALLWHGRPSNLAERSFEEEQRPTKVMPPRCRTRSPCVGGYRV